MFWAAQVLQLNQNSSCYYPFDEGAGSVAKCKFGYGPDLEVGSPGDAWSIAGWVQGSGNSVDQHVGWASDGSALEENLSRNLFQLNNGLMLVAFQISYTTAPISSTRFMSLGGQSGAGTSTLRAIDFLVDTSPAVRLNTFRDDGASTIFIGGNAMNYVSKIMNIVFIIDARSEGRRAIICHYNENESGKVNSVSDNNRYSKSDVGNYLGYPSGLTSGTGLMIGARWRALQQDWFTAEPFQIRRLLIANFKHNDPGNLGAIAYEMLLNNCIPGEYLYGALKRGRQ